MTAASSLRTDVRVISLVAVAHGVSHFFQLTIPPLFPLLKAEFGVSYVALGSVMAVYFAVSGVMQTVAGFAVDRYGARPMLIGGLVLAALGIALAGLAPSFEWLYGAMVIAGLGNSVFHPADLALLNAKVAPRRLGYAFSAHGIAGYLGYAIAPLMSVGIAHVWGWRGAVVAAGLVGAVVVAFIATQHVLAAGTRLTHRPAEGASGLRGDVRLLLSTPVVLCFAFFLLFSMAQSAWQTFSTTALTQMYSVDLVLASSALTAFLIGSAIGVAFGGVAAVRTDRQRTIASLGMLGSAAATLGVGTLALPLPLVMPVAALAGFAAGSVAPARDILVRELTPPGARGKVYGFVYSGLDLAFLAAPLALGSLLDRGAPHMVFVSGAAFMVLSVPTVLLLGQTAAVRRVSAPHA
ncbi:MAG: MFS transporter [Burkholderiales bacterium]|nr:MFS transporter [Burkholderiales bacterium]